MRTATRTRRAAGATPTLPALTPTNGKKDLLIDELLREIFDEVERVAPHRWRMPLSSNGTAVVGEARLEEGWLVFEAAPPPARRAKPWDLLVRNARLRGLAKYALRAGKRSPRLLAEIPIDESIDLHDLARTTVEGMVEALAAAPRDEDARAGDGKEKEKNGAVDLAELCAESGWAATRREQGIAVELPGDRGAHSATVVNGGGRAARAIVVLTDCGAMNDRSRRALAVLLLTGCSAVRHARAVIDDDGGATRAGFEVRLSGAPVPAELDHALSALTVACDLCGPEARVIGDPEVARRYLKVRG